MAKQLTNADRLLQAVLADAKLIEYGGYNPDDYATVDDALISENYCVQAIAKIINDKEQKLSDKEIYNDVSNFLKSCIWF